MDEMLIPFKTNMTAKLIKTLKPETGDFFLTVSATNANKSVRSYSGSKYGHGILYLGSRKMKMLKAASGEVYGFPKTFEPNCAFELPLNCTGLGKILNKDECYMLAHISPKTLSKKQKDKLLYLCTEFVIAKYNKKSGNRSGYSDQMAIVYGLTDTMANHMGGLIVPQEYNPSVAVGRGIVKAFNGAVQTGVQFYEGHPNLNCTSLISWMYKEVGSSITTFSTTTSPSDLYNAVKSSGNFVLKEYIFDKSGPVAA